jgi:hypothetical protein
VLTCEQQGTSLLFISCSVLAWHISDPDDRDSIFHSVILKYSALYKYIVYVGNKIIYNDGRNIFRIVIKGKLINSKLQHPVSLRGSDFAFIVSKE